MKLQENTIFANRYQLERLLGRGGFGEVWLAKDNWTHLHIAIKVYAPGQGMDANGLQEFCGELANVFDLNHTNLLRPTHVDSWNDMPYLIMAYCSQGSVAGKIGQLSEDQIWKLIHDVASGLAYLHAKDVVHQDISPDNILIDESGNYLITDFGISNRARSTLRKSVIKGTTEGGKMAYMGPERFSRQPAPIKASDIWSFGAMLYEVVESDVPFGEIGGGLQKGGADIPDITANISDALKFTIYKMLSKEPWDRPTAEVLVSWSKSPQSILIGEEIPPHKPLNVSNDNITIPPKGTPGSIVEISCNGNWHASVAKTSDWIHIKKSNDNAVAIECAENSTGKSRSGYVLIKAGEQEKRVHVNQASLQVKKRSKIWIVVLLVFGGLIGGAVGIEKYINGEVKNLKETHDHQSALFETSFSYASLDDIVSLENAVEHLHSLKPIEDNKRYRGPKEYTLKREKLIQKTQTLYDEANRKWQRAPSGTETERRNKQKRDKIAEIKARI